MKPTEEQIKQLMATVSCAVCGANYESGSIEILGHRDELWFLRVSCAGCATSGLVAALVKGAEDPSALPEMTESEPDRSPDLDRARVTAPVTRADVHEMRRFLDSFDGDFRGLFGRESGRRSRPEAA
jgi:hypothetical protein